MYDQTTWVSTTLTGLAPKYGMIYSKYYCILNKTIPLLHVNAKTRWHVHVSRATYRCKSNSRMFYYLPHCIVC